MEGLIFREMRPGDEARMRAFYRRLGAQGEKYFNVNGGNERRTMDFFGSSPRPGHTYYVALAGDEVVGHLFIWDTETAVPWLGIAVREDCRGKGVGGFMLTRLFELLSARGYGGLLLRTAADNTAAQRLYEKYGFLPEVLRENGYATFCIGKWHLGNESEMTSAGPYDNWPLGRGFERYYGFLNGATNQFYPELVQDNTMIDPPATPEEGYHLSADLVDHAIRYIGTEKSVYPDKPFFCYLALGAMHSPHHAPLEYIDRFAGQFDEGYEVYREKVFKRQQEMGLLPEGAVLT